MSSVTKEQTTTTVTHPPVVGSMNTSTTSSSMSSSSSSASSSSSSSSSSSLAQQINAGITSIGENASQAVKSLDNSLGVSKALNDFDATHHVSAKLGDAASHMSAAINRGNPVHAFSHATTAAKIGEAERIKHEKGPMPGSSNDNVEPKEHTDYQADPSQHKTSNSIADVGDHVKASLAHGNVIHAAKYAGAAAAIGEVEREKHQRGPLPEQLVDQPENEHVNVPAGHVSHAV